MKLLLLGALIAASLSSCSNDGGVQTPGATTRTPSTDSVLPTPTLSPTPTPGPTPSATSIPAPSTPLPTPTLASETSQASLSRREVMFTVNVPENTPPEDTVYVLVLPFTDWSWEPGQHVPLTARFQNIKDRVEDFTHVDCSRTASRFSAWNVGFNQFPLIACQVTWVRFSVHHLTLTAFCLLFKQLLRAI